MNNKINTTILKNKIKLEKSIFYSSFIIGITGNDALIKCGSSTSLSNINELSATYIYEPLLFLLTLTNFISGLHSKPQLILPYIYP